MGEGAGAAEGLESRGLATDGFRANISRILLRPSNSGISLPDIGSISLVICSLFRTPSTKMPGGFTTSLTSYSLPSKVIRSLITAYTGQ